MTARQFLLNESLYCRRKAEGCADRFIAVELRRLAEAFELKAEAGRPHSRPVGEPDVAGIYRNFSRPEIQPNARDAGSCAREQTGTRHVPHAEHATAAH